MKNKHKSVSYARTTTSQFEEPSDLHRKLSEVARKNDFSEFVKKNSVCLCVCISVWDEYCIVCISQYCV